MATWFQVLEAVLSFAGPVIVAWFSVKMNKMAKDNAKIKQLEDEKAAREKKDLIDSINEISESLKAIGEQADETARKVDELTNVDSRFSDKVDSIVRQQRLIGMCSHRLAQLVITVATGMRDQHLDGNITHAVDEYHAFEQSTLAGIMTSSDD